MGSKTGGTVPEKAEERKNQSKYLVGGANWKGLEGERLVMAVVRWLSSYREKGFLS